MALQIRRGTEAQRAALTGVDVPVLGELLYTTDTKKLYVGDGVTGGGTEVGYFSSIEVSGENTLTTTGETGTLTFEAGNNITITTDDNTNRLTIEAASFTGGTVDNLVVGETFSPTPTDLSVEIEGFSNRMMRMVSNMSSFDTTASPFIQMAAYRASPANNDAGPKLEFRQSTDVSSDEIIAGIRSVVTNVANGSEAGKLVFDVINSLAVVSIDSSGFVGDLTGNVAGDVTGNVTGNVYAIDTTLLVNASTKEFNGNLNGDVTGNVTGNVSGFVTGDVKGSVFADDSTVLVDSVAGVLRGEHIGTLTGNVTGNLSGDVNGRLLTTQLEIVNNSITSRSGNDSISINPSGSGSVNISSNVITNGLQIFGPSTDGSSGDGALRVATPIHTAATLQVVDIHNTAVATGGVIFARGRGDITAYQNQVFETVQNNDSLKNLIFAGHDGTDFRQSSGILAFVDGTVSAGYVPGRLEFATVQSGGAFVTRLTVNDAAVASTVPFKLPIYADDAARTAGIATPEQGMMIFMQSGTAPAATNQMQVFNGTAWISL